MTVVPVRCAAAVAAERGCRGVLVVAGKLSVVTAWFRWCAELRWRCAGGSRWWLVSAVSGVVAMTGSLLLRTELRWF